MHMLIISRKSLSVYVYVFKRERGKVIEIVGRESLFASGQGCILLHIVKRIPSMWYWHLDIVNSESDMATLFLANWFSPHTK